MIEVTTRETRDARDAQETRLYKEVTLQDQNFIPMLEFCLVYYLLGLTTTLCLTQHFYLLKVYADVILEYPSDAWLYGLNIMCVKHTHCFSLLHSVPLCIDHDITFHLPM